MGLFGKKKQKQLIKPVEVKFEVIDQPLADSRYEKAALELAKIFNNQNLSKDEKQLRLDTILDDLGIANHLQDGLLISNRAVYLQNNDVRCK